MSSSTKQTAGVCAAVTFVILVLGMALQPDADPAWRLGAAFIVVFGIGTVIYAVAFTAATIFTDAEPDAVEATVTHVQDCMTRVSSEAQALRAGTGSVPDAVLAVDNLRSAITFGTFLPGSWIARRFLALELRELAHDLRSRSTSTEVAADMLGEDVATWSTLRRIHEVLDRQRA